MHRSVIVGEGLELQLGTGLLGDKLVRACADRLLGEGVLADLLIVFRRDDPPGAADIGRPDQRRKIEKRHVEHKADRAVVDYLDARGFLMHHLGPRTLVMLVAPGDIGRSDRGAVMKLEPRAEPEYGALRVFGELEMLGERQVIELFVIKVLDQRVLHDVEEIVGRGAADMLLRVEPARRDVGVPGEGHAAGSGRPRRRGAPYER